MGSLFQALSSHFVYIASPLREATEAKKKEKIVYRGGMELLILHEFWPVAKNCK